MKYLVILFTIVLFSCQNYDQSESVPIPEGALELEEDIEIEPPRSMSGNWSTDDEGFAGGDLLAYNDQRTTQKTTTQPQEETSKKDKKKIIRKAKLDIEVADYKQSMEEIRNLAKRFDTEISSEAEYRNAYRVQNDLEFRIVPDKLEEFIKEIEQIAEIVTYKQISVNDVTKKYFSLQTRLEAREATILRYQQLLAQANNVTEVLAVEKELRDAIEDRDVIKGEIKYLNDQVGRSTVTLGLIQNLEYHSQRRGFFTRIGNAFADGWRGFLEFSIGMVGAWPFILILVVVIGLLMRYQRRRKV